MAAPGCRCLVRTQSGGGGEEVRAGDGKEEADGDVGPEHLDTGEQEGQAGLGGERGEQDGTGAAVAEQTHADRTTRGNPHEVAELRGAADELAVATAGPL